MVGFIILKNFFLYLSYYILNPLKNKVVNQLREDLYDKLLRLPIGFFNEKRKGDLMSRMANDVGEVEGSVVGTLEGWIRDPLTIIVTLTVLVPYQCPANFIYSDSDPCARSCYRTHHPVVEKTFRGSGKEKRGNFFHH